MGRTKQAVTVHTNTNGAAGEYARAWVSEDLAGKLDLAVSDWVYLSMDWLGVLSTQAMVEGVLQGSDGQTIMLSPDRMTDGHFKDGDSMQAWKQTEWE